MNDNRPSSENFPPSAPGYPPGSPGPQRVAVAAPNLTPVVSYSLLAVTILAYILQEASVFIYGEDLPAAFGMKINEFILVGQYWRLLTPMLLHGSALHIAGNMYALYSFGPQMERHFGHGRFLALYLLSGLAGNIASFLFTPAPSLGSSTAIFGLLGAEGVFLYTNRKLFGGVAQRALTQLVMIAAFNLIIGLSPRIDNWGHIGGLVGGTLFAWLAGPVMAVEGIYPNLSLADTREPVTILQAAAGLGLVLIILAAAAIYLNGGRLP